MDTIVDVCVGDEHSCALARDGRVACWGSNGAHQISADSVGQFDAPRWVSELPPAVRLRCAPEAICVQTRRGGIECLGFQYSPRPGQVGTVGLNAIVQDFTVTERGGCAILDDRHVSCWSSAHFANPEPVAGLDDAQSFAVSSPDGLEWCVARTSHAPTCLSYGAGLDPSKALPPPFSPHQVPALMGATHLMSPDYRTLCANELPGKPGVKCIGANGAPEPGAFEGRTTVQFLATNGTLSCVREASTVRCSASNGDLYLSSSIPNDVEVLALGATHACALVNGRVRCWGQARSGQLGDGARYLHEPEPVPGVADATHLFTGEGVTCALRRSNKLSCWGLSRAWSRLEDYDVVDVPLTAPFSDLSIDHGLPCGHFGKPRQCWTGAAWEPRVQDESDSSKRALSDSGEPPFACSLSHEGEITCSSARTSSRSSVKGVPQPIDLAVSGVSACATSRDGRVYCWGSNRFGGAPNGAPSSHGDPVQVLWPPK